MLSEFTATALSRPGCAYAGTMTKNSLWTTVGVVLAIVIAWWIVSALFSLLWFISKLAIVVVVAVVVFLVLRSLFRADGD